jgi:LPXTG-motif cell wall-anchored protein
MLSQAHHYTVDLFRRALDVAHQEGYSPTLYSQVYELNSGTIHLYLYHDFEHEVVLNLAEELAKGPHIVTIQSLFPPNSNLNQWAAEQIYQWQAGYEEMIEPGIPSGSQGWMSGQYDVVQEPDTGPVKIYLEKDQLYMQRPNQLPIELYPAGPDTVFHHFLNGFDLTFTFQRNLWGQVTGALGTFNFEPYNISLPYDLTRPGIPPDNTSLWLTLAGLGIVLILLGSLLFVHRKQKGSGGLPGQVS